MDAQHYFNGLLIVALVMRAGLNTGSRKIEVAPVKVISEPKERKA